MILCVYNAKPQHFSYFIKAWPLLWVSVVFIFLEPSLVWSLSADKKEKVYIVADSTTYFYKTGVKIFEGHVQVDQGTTHLTADRVVTKDNAKHQMTELIAYGYHVPAHYWTRAKMGDPEIHAHAKIIKYFPLQANITLEEQVLVAQGENSFKGQLIHYNMDDQTITVPASKNARAELIYSPD